MSVFHYHGDYIHIPFLCVGRCRVGTSTSATSNRCSSSVKPQASVQYTKVVLHRVMRSLETLRYLEPDYKGPVRVSSGQAFEYHASRRCRPGCHRQVVARDVDGMPLAAFPCSGCTWSRCRSGSGGVVLAGPRACLCRRHSIAGLPRRVPASACSAGDAVLDGRTSCEELIAVAEI